MMIDFNKMLFAKFFLPIEILNHIIVHEDKYVTPIHCCKILAFLLFI